MSQIYSRTLSQRAADAVGTAASLGSILGNESRDQVDHLIRAGVPKRKGSYGRRLLRSKVVDGVRFELHATKGWRRRGAAT